MLITHNISIKRIFKNTWKMDIILIVSSTVAYFFHTRLIQYHFEIPTFIPSILGTAIAFFIGFNNNQAYQRWWEARQIWGALVNDSRTWARDVINYTTPGSMTDNELYQLRRAFVCRHIAFLYALKGKLRSTDTHIHEKYLTEEEVAEVNKQSNMHNAILNIQSRELRKLRDNNMIDGYTFLQMDAMLVAFCDSMGKSERIKNTVFPTTYAFLTKIFIWLFVFFIALVISDQSEQWAILFSWIIGFVFVATQANGMDLVDPFENKSTSIPLNQITRTIEINLLQMLGHEEHIPEPIKPINGEYVL